jgi:predicted ferric reductase
MGLFKRGVTFNGLDCLKDANMPAYESAHMKLQAEVPWGDQPSYGKYTVYFGVVVIFIAFVKNIWYRYLDYSYKKNPQSGNSFVNVLSSYFRFVGYKQVPGKICYYTSLPTSIGSTLFLMASTIYLFCYCLIPHFWYRGCRGFGSPPLAVRAGIMATALTPFVYVLSGKSNMITFITGISYEKLNVFHQYVGVAALVLSVIHTIPFIFQDLAEGGAEVLHLNFTSDFAYYSGLLPLILLGLLCVLSKAWFRKVCYEGFLHLHWMFGIAYFGTLWWHINYTLGMQDYMYGALAFWATQVIYRILIKTTFRPNSLFMKPRRAELSKLGPNAYEISVSGEHLKWKPGQHCFLRFVGTRMLDNHPFSVCSILNEDSRLKFIVIPKKGLTKQLYSELDEYAITNKKVFLDGPYGGTARDPTSFDNVVLMATGSGITATLPFLSTIANEIQQAKKDNKPFICRNINFVWVIRHINDLSWIDTELNRCLEIAGDYINTDIYVCHGKSEQQQSSEDTKTNKSALDIEKTIEAPSISNDAINLHYFRPFIPDILFKLSRTLGRRNMVVCSGADSMKQETSRTIANLQPMIFNNDINNLRIEEIYLHTESFGW